MANQHGHIIEHDGASGIVESVSTVMLKQPDLVTKDATTGEEVSRQSRPDVEAIQVHVVYEDGSTGDLTECIDTWTVIGSVEVFPEIKDPVAPPPGAHGELPEQQKATDAAIADITNVVAEAKARVEAAAAAVATERTVEVVEDGVLAIAGE